MSVDKTPPSCLGSAVQLKISDLELPTTVFFPLGSSSLASVVRIICAARVFRCSTTGKVSMTAHCSLAAIVFVDGTRFEHCFHN